MLTVGEREADYKAETDRILELIRSRIKQKSPSIRHLEMKLQVSPALLNKVLNGKITLQVRHLLILADALEMPWAELFGELYGFSTGTSQRISPEFRSSVVTILLELGVIDPSELERKPRSKRTESKSR